MSVFEWHSGVVLITSRMLRGSAADRGRVWGAYVLDRNKGNVTTIGARFTIIATGGTGKVYLFTANADSATGRAIALALRPRSPVPNTRFSPLRPSCLFAPPPQSFLSRRSNRGASRTPKP